MTAGQTKDRYGGSIRFCHPKAREQNPGAGILREVSPQVLHKIPSTVTRMALKNICAASSICTTA